MLSIIRIARRILNPIMHLYQSLEHVVRDIFGLTQSEDRLVQDAQHLWNDQSWKDHNLFCHWRGSGIFKDDQKWLSLGESHLKIFQTFAKAAEIIQPIQRIVEWGCGGGANAVHFAPLCKEFIGVDVNQESLDECSKQMKEFGLKNFKPVLIKVDKPDTAIDEILQCNLFLCTYVFEVLPTPEYGFRLLKIAHSLLQTGGLAIIQIKYPNQSYRTQSRRWNYFKNLAHNVTYTIEEFWQASQVSGFTPLLVTLVPKVEMLNDERYAFFALLKK